MAARSYYVILGVPADAPPGAIRSAFRRLALRYHPDRGTEADPGRFHEAVEAYGVLSDPARRARYDRGARPEWPRPLAPRHRAVRPEPEPLIPEAVPIADGPESVRPSYDGLIERLARNFVGAAPKAERLEPLHFELVLSREDAEVGARVPLSVPVFVPCPPCIGTGRSEFGRCGLCAGDGRLVDEARVDLVVPRGVRDGTLLEISLEDLGVRNLWLRVRVRVAAP